MKPDKPPESFPRLFIISRGMGHHKPFPPVLRLSLRRSRVEYLCPTLTGGVDVPVRKISWPRCRLWKPSAGNGECRQIPGMRSLMARSMSRYQEKLKARLGPPLQHDLGGVRAGSRLRTRHNFLTDARRLPSACPPRRSLPPSYPACPRHRCLAPARRSRRHADADHHRTVP